LDWDFVLPGNAVETAKTIASRYGAGFVTLDRARQIARVVFPLGTVDFARQEGESLEQDLGRRDFTVNAIAYNFHREEIIDPQQGRRDLGDAVLKMISPANLRDDPLRLLRAYRQAAQLQFQLDSETHLALRQLAPLIGGVAAERAQAEFNYLLGSPRGSAWLWAAFQDGLLAPWFPQATRESLNTLCCIDLALARLKTQLDLSQRQALFEALGKKGIALAKLASLTSADPEGAERELERLKYSRQEIRAVGAVLRAYPASQRGELPQSRRLQYFFFLEAGKYLPLFVLYALARAPAPDHQLILKLLAHFLDPEDALAHPQNPVSGVDLIQGLGLKPGPLIGKLLTEVQVAQIEGKVQSKEDALAYARLLIDCYGSLP
jgi:tRNA nucleotidyltransferase (CCA-adding enzyme)